MKILFWYVYYKKNVSQKSFFSATLETSSWLSNADQCPGTLLIILDGHWQSGILTPLLTATNHDPHLPQPTEFVHYREQWKSRTGTRKQNKAWMKKQFQVLLLMSTSTFWNFHFVDGGVGLVWLRLALTSVKPFMFLLWILGHYQGDWKRMWRKFKCGSVKGRGEYWLASLPFGEIQLCPEHWSSTHPLVPKETMWVYTFISMLRP